MKLNFSISKQQGSFRLEAKGSFEHGLVGIFGDSGSGKTTLLKCLTGVVQPDQGEISVEDKVLFSSEQKINIPLEQRNLGMVFQEALLFPHMTVKKNITYGVKKGIAKKYVDEVVDLLKVYKLLDRMPSTLSGGEQQRVALARSLLHEPSCLLMDEPISALDLKTRRGILHYLREVYRRLKIPIVYVSHSISELLFLVEQVLILEDGRSGDYGEPCALLAEHHDLVDPQDPIENIYELPVKEIKQSEGLVVLALGDQLLYVAYPAARITPSLKVGLKANDLIVAKDQVWDTSARNCLAAVVEEIIPQAQNFFLKTRIGQNRCLVNVTQSALDQLGLSVGQTVYLIIKATSILVLD